MARKKLRYLLPGDATKGKERAGRGLRPALWLFDAKIDQAACLVSIARLSSAIEPRFEKVTAIARAISDTTTIATRSGVTPPRATVVNGAARIATRFITLIIGFSAGPAVSLNGSPTVSPTTDALCTSVPLPPRKPSSTFFLALSQLAPAFDMKTAIS